MNDLYGSLQEVLPRQRFQALNLQSFPKESARIFADHENETSTAIKTQHFFLLCEDKVPILGIEIFVYVIVNLNSKNKLKRILYVSKVDSTGLVKSRVRLTGIVTEYLKYLLKLPVSHYTNIYLTKSNKPSNISTKKMLKKMIKGESLQKGLIEFGSFASCQELDGIKCTTQISLFTRAEKQYLFPLSYENKGKHISSDKQLLSWWIALLNRLSSDKSVFAEFKAQIDIPGEEKMVAKRFIKNLENWDLFKFEDPSEKAKYCIPLFPDDPKGRFLENLVMENRINKISVRKFWQELAVRQEFRLTSIVGIICIKGFTSENSDFKCDNSVSPRTFQLTVDQLKERGIMLNDTTMDCILMSKRKLKKLKGYIVGEEYDNLETAQLVYDNVEALLPHGFKDIEGTVAKREAEASSHEAKKAKTD